MKKLSPIGFNFLPVSVAGIFLTIDVHRNYMEDSLKGLSAFGRARIILNRLFAYMPVKDFET